MSDSIAHFFLFFSHFKVIFPILLIGLLVGKRTFVLCITYLVLLDLIVNVALKGTFKFPLAPWLHPGYALPSGHMQLVTVFYGWLALHISSIGFRLAILGILVGEGFGLIHCRYHDLWDVITAMAVGTMLIIAYQYAWKYFKHKTPWFLMVFATICMIYNLYIYTEIPKHATVAYFVLIIILSIERIVSHNGRRYSSME